MDMCICTLMHMNHTTHREIHTHTGGERGKGGGGGGLMDVKCSAFRLLCCGNTWEESAGPQDGVCIQDSMCEPPSVEVKKEWEKMM